jgi:uncharacterized membrane protein (UPF0182 family)
MNSIYLVIVSIVCISSAMAFRSIELKKNRKSFKAFRILWYAYILAVLAIAFQAYIMNHLK